MGVRKMVGKKFFVSVSVMRDMDTTIPTLSGQLHAKSRSDAEIEAGRYRDWLNEGQDELGPSYFVVKALTEAEVKAIPNSDDWARGRMAPTFQPSAGSVVPRKTVELPACARCEGTGLVERPVLGDSDKIQRMLCGLCKGRGTIRPYAKTT